MYIQVRLLKGYTQPLIYEVPNDWVHYPHIGSFVHVPIRTKTVTAIVEKIIDKKPAVSFTIKAAHRLEKFPHDLHYFSYIKKLGAYYQLDTLYFLKRIGQFITEKHRTMRIEEEHDQSIPAETITLTSDQKTIVDQILPTIHQPTFMPSLLHGVTGSGKTEIYKELIIAAHAQGKTTILLLPEVTLALRFEQILHKTLPEAIAIYGFHSTTRISEKRAAWTTLLKNEPCLIIGVHLPIFLPIANLGLIIIDEEHEIGYQEKKHPKINSKEAALLRAQIYNIPILLGSATPSISSLYNVHHKKWQFFELKHRFAGNFPRITTVSLQEKKNQRKNFWISKELSAAIEDRLSQQEQTIIFLNRRGYSFFVQCKQCAHVFTCNQCSVSLTLHHGNTLRCHYCDFAMLLPQKCSCSSQEFLKKGIGTQQLVSLIQELFPAARIARADLDTTSKKTVWQQTMQDFEKGDIDILIGTQTITKGFHFPRVTLVGILWADLNLHFPIYNASESTLQQLIQVAGRAGRQSMHSDVIVQIMDEHTIFEYITEENYPAFYAHEIQKRELLGYPPYKRLAEIELKHTDEATIIKESHRLAEELRALAPKYHADTTVLGPASPPIHTIKNTHMRKIYIKSATVSDIIRLYQSIDHSKFTASLFFTPNPLS
ncbi:MAG: primosomal protein N' [Candidatus Babeliales bacterium]